MFRWLLTTFIAVAILTSAMPWLRRLGIGRLPGDITLRRAGRVYVLPFASTLLLSILLSLLVRLL